MISPELAEVLNTINVKTTYIRNMKNCAKTFRDKEQENRKEAEAYEAAALTAEVETDQLQLDLRRVLNGQPAEIPVAAPLIADEQVGREA